MVVAQRLDHNAPAVGVEWQVNAIPRSKSGWIQVLFLVSGKDEQGRSVPTKNARCGSTCRKWVVRISNATCGRR